MTLQINSNKTKKPDFPLEKMLLGEGLELWKVHISDLQEQDLNARTMPPEMFMRLTDNIKRRGALESLPLCTFDGKKLEIVSGHHRTRAARKAGISELWVMVDVSNLSPDQVKAKQLAHNSIQGEDNSDLVRQIYEQIDDIEAKIEAYISMPELDTLKEEKVTLSSKDLEVGFDTKCVAISFLPVQYKAFQHAITILEGHKPEEVYLATRGEYEELVSAMDVVSKEYDIKSVPTIFSKMAELAVSAVEAEKSKKPEKEAEA